jgi:hypothetical protein
LAAGMRGRDLKSVEENIPSSAFIKGSSVPNTVEMGAVAGRPPIFS